MYNEFPYIQEHASKEDYDDFKLDIGWRLERYNVGQSALCAILDNKEHPIILRNKYCVFGIMSHYGTVKHNMYIHYFATRQYGYGYGRELLLYAYLKAAALKINIVLHSSQEAQNFYEKYGMECVGGNSYFIPLHTINSILDRESYPF